MPGRERAVRRTALLLAVALAGAGCAGGEAPRSLSGRLVDPKGPPPLINAFDRDPTDGSYLLTSNKGFFRIDPRTKAVTRVKGSVTGPTGSSPVGRYLELSVADAAGALLGSGHPDDPSSSLPAYLGLMRSDDAGASWQIISQFGNADLHEIVRQGDRLYAFDALKGALMISRDGGRTFTARATPRGLVLSMALDPSDPERIAIATDDQVYRTTDGGARWRPLVASRGPRVAWPARDALVRTDADGSVLRSSDGGDSWRPVGRIDAGVPYKLKALDERRLAAALSDGMIVASQDGGASWKVQFRP